MLPPEVGVVLSLLWQLPRDVDTDIPLRYTLIQVFSCVGFLGGAPDKVCI